MSSAGHDGRRQAARAAGKLKRARGVPRAKNSNAGIRRVHGGKRGVSGGLCRLARHLQAAVRDPLDAHRDGRLVAPAWRVGREGRRGIDDPAREGRRRPGPLSPTHACQPLRDALGSSPTPLCFTPVLLSTGTSSSAQTSVMSPMGACARGEERATSQSIRRMTGRRLAMQDPRPSLSFSPLQSARRCRFRGTRRRRRRSTGRGRAP